MIRYHLVWLSFVVCFFCMTTHARPLTVSAENTWGGIFAGEVSPYEIKLSGNQNNVYLLTWRVIAKGRTLSTGQQTIRFLNNPLVTARLPLRTPPLNPGVSLEAKLVIEVSNEQHADQQTRYESSIVIYGPDLLLENQRFYQHLNIQLFDPIGKTSKLLDDLRIPYQSITKTQLLNLTSKGMVVVAASIDLAQYRGLISTLINYAGEGRQVLVLKPSSGTFSLSRLPLNSDHRPSAMSFADQSIIQSFSGDYNWVGKASIKTHGIAIHTHRQAILGQVVAYDQASWDWFQLDYDATGGKFIICMLPLLEYVDDGPVPQILFSRLLAYAKGQLSGLTQSASRKAQK